MIRIILIALSLLISLPTLSDAACSTTVTCTQGETGTCRQPADNTLTKVQECVDASSAGDGTVYVDGVYLNTDSQTWSGALTIDGKHGIVIKGNATATITAGGSSSIISAETTAVKKARITGTKFALVESGGYRYFAFKTPENFRFDNNTISGTAAGYILLFWGATASGVVDSNTVGTVGSPLIITTGNGFVYREGTANYHTSRVDFTDFSTNKDWIFVEGNTLYINNTSSGSEMIENDDGGHLYSRFNLFYEVAGRLGSILEQHNRSQGWGGRAQVFHNNKIVLTQNNTNAYVLIRNGTALVYNNLIDYSARNASFDFAYIRNYRAMGGATHEDTETYDCATFPGHVNTSDPAGPGFTETMLSECCSASYTSAGFTGEGVPCVGPGVGVWGVDSTYEPIYLWNNHITPDGTTMTDVETVGKYVSTEWAVRDGYEYCVSTSASTPSSCGTATLSYTPPACPHALTGNVGKTCDNSVAGPAGYSLNTTQLGTGGTIGLGAGGTITLQ